MSLTLQQFAEAKKLPVQFLKDNGIREEDDGRGGRRIVIPYLDEGGNEVAIRYRNSLTHERFTFTWRKGDKPTLYGLELIEAARAAGYVVLAEGESDVLTLRLHGFPALGLPGAGWNEDHYADYFTNIRRVIVIDEKDGAAEKLIASLTQSEIRARSEVVSLNGCKDPSELHCRNPDAFCDSLKEAIKNAKPLGGETNGGSTAPPNQKMRSDKPEIFLRIGETERAVDELEAALVASGKLYQRGGLIVSTSTMRLPTWDKKTVIAQVIEERGDYALREDAEAVAKFVKLDAEGKEIPTAPPMALIKTLKDRKYRLRFPVLNGITSCPSIAIDGTLLDKPGYDPATGIL